MTTKDIELLFENELGIEEVCVWSYDEKSKTLDMHFEIDIKKAPENHYQSWCFQNLNIKFEKFKTTLSLSSHAATQLSLHPLF